MSLKNDVTYHSATFAITEVTNLIYNHFVFELNRNILEAAA